jgi:hypothetical protein
MQGEFQMTASVIHIFSMVWNSPRLHALLHGGKPFRVGTPLTYKQSPLAAGIYFPVSFFGDPSCR